MDIFKAVLLAGSGMMLVSGLLPPKRAQDGRDGKGSVYRGQPFEFIVRYLASLACVST